MIAFLCGGGSKPACPASGTPVTGTIVAADILDPAAQVSIVAPKRTEPEADLSSKIASAATLGGCKEVRILMRLPSTLARSPTRVPGTRPWIDITVSPAGAYGYTMGK